MSCNPIIRAFNANAFHYNKKAFVQQRIADQFFSLLPMKTIRYGLLLDVGCGTGFLTKKIKKTHPDNTLIALDAAPDMLSQLPKFDRLQLICADFNAIPLMDACCEAVFSNVALQWSRETTRSLQEWLRVLKPGGRLHFSTLLDGTLIEWNRCWENLADERRVNALLTQKTLETIQLPDNCQWLKKEAQTLVEYYKNVEEALASVREIGASRRLEPLKKNGLIGRQKWSAFLSTYNTMRTESGLPLTYEVFYGTIEKK
jgi:malonyl-CoA O-methyltransferase